MVRSPCSSDDGLKKGPWSPEEDQRLIDYVNKHGYGSWQALPKRAGLNRCGKSCRLRWTNYLRPDIKRGGFSDEEEKAIISLHSVLGNKWSRIASHLPGRTDNEIKNYWNTHLRKKLIKSGIDPQTHTKIHDFDLLSNNLSQLHSISNMLNLFNPLEIALAAQIFAKNQLIQNILQATNTNPFPNFQETSMILPGSENLVVLDGPIINGEISNNPINYNDSARSGLEIHRNSQHAMQLLNAYPASTNSSCNIVEGDFNPENILPPLVISTSATPGSSNLNIMDNIDDMYIFDDLEKIVDSDANSFLSWTDTTS